MQNPFILACRVKTIGNDTVFMRIKLNLLWMDSIDKGIMICKFFFESIFCSTFVEMEKLHALVNRTGDKGVDVWENCQAPH
jgi:hypothetical protein